MNAQDIVQHEKLSDYEVNDDHNKSSRSFRGVGQWPCSTARRNQAQRRRRSAAKLAQGR